MIVILKSNPNMAQLENLINWLQSKGIQIHTSVGMTHTILGLVGDTSVLDIDLIAALDIVADVKRVQEPYKNANRKFHPEDTVITVGGVTIGGGTLTVMAGPCSVETEEQVVTVARAVKKSGATRAAGPSSPELRPIPSKAWGRTGSGCFPSEEEETGLPIVTEIMDVSRLPFDDVDVIQVGARNMQISTC